MDASSDRNLRPASTDVLVIVPKVDELYWVGAAFDFDFDKPDRLLPPESKPVYDRTFRDATGNPLQLSFVVMDEQGNTASSLITREAIATLDPTLAVLVGTALGNPKRCAVGDVVLSVQVAIVTEPKALEEGKYSWRGRHLEPAGRMRRDAGRFREFLDVAPLAREYQRLWSERQASIRGPQVLQGIHHESVASGDILIADEQLAQQLWNYDDRLACYDMESAGFSRVLGSQAEDSHNGASGVNRAHELDWIVVRGISDFGNATSKGSVTNRQAASIAAGLVLREFLSAGLKECHPFQLRPPTDMSGEIPADHFYVKKSGTQYFRSRIKNDLGVELPIDQPLRSRTVAALSALLFPLTHAKRDDVVAYLEWLRAQYFEEKYSDYTYDHDLRSLLPAWALEVREIVRGDLNLPRAGLEVLDVGVGNGLELEALFGEEGVVAGSVTGVDVSVGMLDVAAARFPGLKTLCASAESLVGIESRTIDLYVSLRTYMSRLFDAPRALEEAVRVLRPGGGIVLSIANGYVVEDGGKRQLVRGLTVSGGEAIDLEKPHAIAFRLLRLLWDFGFEDTGHHSSTTDVYVWGRAPRAHGRGDMAVEEILRQRITSAKAA